MIASNPQSAAIGDISCAGRCFTDKGSVYIELQQITAGISDQCRMMPSAVHNQTLRKSQCGFRDIVIDSEFEVRITAGIDRIAFPKPTSSR